MKKKIVMLIGVVIVLIGCIYSYNKYQYSKTMDGMMAKYEEEYLKIRDMKIETTIDASNIEKKSNDLAIKIKDLVGDKDSLGESCEYYGKAMESYVEHIKENEDKDDFFYQQYESRLRLSEMNYYNYLKNQKGTYNERMK